MEKKKLSSRSKASSALYDEQENAPNIKWPTIFSDRMW